MLAFPTDEQQKNVHPSLNFLKYMAYVQNTEIA